MNESSGSGQRIFFWISFVVVLGLIVWGLIAAMKKGPIAPKVGVPAPVTAGEHIRGPADAPITLIEYSDFQCPACRSYYPLVEQLMNESSTTVRLVYRHFPLPQHANAVLAGRAAEAAGNQGKFWEMYHLLFENQNTWEGFSDTAARQTFMDYAGSLLLNATTFARDMDSTEAMNKVEADKQSGLDIGVNATPSFFVNGKFIQPPPQYDAFKAIIISTTTNANI